MLRELVRQCLSDAVDAAENLGPHTDRPDIRVEYARDEKFGDYACTVAMDKRFRELYAEREPSFKNPKNFAGALLEAVESYDGARPPEERLFASIDVAGPGFLNLTISPAALWRYAKLAADDRAKYGHSTKANPRKIIFEFVSANPTGPLNVVSARAAALGDACCRLLTASGEDVTPEFYVNDYGNQVELLGRSCLLRYAESEGLALKFFDAEAKVYPDGPGLPFPSGGYHGEYIPEAVAAVVQKRPELKLTEDALAKLKDLAQQKDVAENFIEEDETFLQCAREFGAATIDHFLSTQQRDLKQFRVNFANFFRESSLHSDGRVLAAREKLGTHVYEENGKALFRSTDFGDDKDRVIIRDDGRPTYLLADIAYHHTKIERGFSQIYNIWGPDHHGYIARLAGAMRAMDFPEDEFRVLIAQQVRLLQDGAELIMSKRKGQLITMAELMEEVPVDVSRYFFVMRTFESHLDFDLDEARDTSDKNPYYYVAYAHARIHSIFRNAAERDLGVLKDVAAWQGAVDLELSEERRRLLVLLARFPDEVADAALALEPHRLVTYLYELATALSRFYGKKENKVIDHEAQTAAALLSILDAVAVCLKNGLEMLGMEAPDRMDQK